MLAGVKGTVEATSQELPGAVERITWSDVHGSRLSFDDAAQRLKPLPLRAVVRALVDLNMRLARAPNRSEASLQKKLLGTLLPGRSSLKEAVIGLLDGGNVHRGLFYEPALLAALKLAILHCARKEGDLDDQAREELLSVMLIVDDNVPKTPDDPSSQDAMRDVILNAWAVLEDAWRKEMARWDEMLLRIAKHPGLSYHLPAFEQLFQQATGHGVSEFRKFGSVLLETFFPRVGSAAQICSRRPSDSRRGKLFDLFCATADGFADQFRRCPSFASEPFYTLPFQQHPLLDVDGEVYCVSRKYLIQRFTSGVFHIVLTHLGPPPSEQSRAFLKFKGDLFHAYVGELLEKIKRIIHRLDAQTEPDGAGKKRSDFVVPEGDRAVVVECKSRLVPLRVKAGGDFAALRCEYEEIIFKAAEQLESTIGQITAGEIKGLDPNRIRRYYPVVCTLDYLPTDFTIYPNIEAELQERGLLQGAIIAPLQVLDVGSLERLVPYMLHGLVLSELLEKKNSGGPLLRAESFWNYLFREGVLPANP